HLVLVPNTLTAVHQPQRRNDELHQILELAGVGWRSHDLGRQEHRAQYGGDVAPGPLECSGHGVDQRRWRIVSDEISDQLGADEARSGALPAEERHGLLALREAVADETLIEHGLGPEVVTVR